MKSAILTATATGIEIHLPKTLTVNALERRAFHWYRDVRTASEHGAPGAALAQEQPPSRKVRPWFISHARSKAEPDADTQPWSAQQVREFHEHLDRTPTNHRDLADLAVLRVLDLKDDLENGDNSVAQVLLQVREETVLRNYLTHELREKAFGR